MSSIIGRSSPHFAPLIFSQQQVLCFLLKAADEAFHSNSVHDLCAHLKGSDDMKWGAKGGGHGRRRTITVSSLYFYYILIKSSTLKEGLPAYETFSENMGWSLFHRSMKSNHFSVDSIWLLKLKTSQIQGKDEPKTSQIRAKDESKMSQRPA